MTFNIAVTPRIGANVYPKYNSTYVGVADKNILHSSGHFSEHTSLSKTADVLVV